MTHADIYKKFMIEYDKANIASSYPSLTPYEVATILDKAYLALIARKMTGNNPRQSTFESDTKSIEDLRPLIVNKVLNRLTDVNNRGIYADNEYAYKFNDDMLYYIEGQVQYNENTSSIDQKGHKNELVNLVSHELAQHFKATNTNMPWIKQPVSFIENDYIHVLIDSYKHRNAPTFCATYLKKPKKFVNDDSSSGGQEGGTDPGDDPQITVNDPEFTPRSKTFSDSFSVTISTRDGSSIYYTTDGSNPKTSGIEYISAIPVNNTVTIKAAAYKNGVWSNVVTESYTKQQPQDPQQGSPSVSIQECKYRLDTQNMTEKVYIVYTVSKGGFDGDLFIDLEISGTGGAFLKVKNKEKVTSFDSAISYGIDNFRYKDTLVKIILYDKNNNILDNYIKSISNMPSNIPTVTIQECKYISADGDIPERIKIVHSIDFKNSNIPVDRFINIENKSSVIRTGEKTFNITQNVNNEDIYTSYNTGDYYVDISIISAISGALCNTASKHIDNLPTNSPETPNPEEGFDDDPSAPSLGEQTSNNLGEATLGEIILQ